MYQLCFARDNVLYFTDNFEIQWGDDWDDAPADCNAGEPYEYDENDIEQVKDMTGHIRRIGFYGNWIYVVSSDQYSVQEINIRQLPLLRTGWSKDVKVLNAGATMEEAEKFLQDCGAYYGELIKHE